MKKRGRPRIGLRGKFVIRFLLLGTGMIVVTVFAMSVFVFYFHTTNYMDTMWGAAYLMQSGLSESSGQMKSYGLLGRTDSAYDEMCEKLQELKEACELIDNYFIICPVSETEAFWVTAEVEGERKQAGSRVEDFETEEWDCCRRVLSHAAEGGADYRTKGTEKFVWVSGHGEDHIKICAYYPVENGEEGVVAILGLEEYTKSLPEEIVAYVGSGAVYISVLFFVQAVILLAFVQSGIIRSIQNLREGVQKMSEGELEVSVLCERNDELGDITEGFNRMAAHISGHIREMEELNRACQRFVPPETLALLHKESIADIRLGDQAVVDLTILAMEPERAVAVLPELGSEETFAYINRMFARTVAAALAMEGRVWQFEKAAVYVSFPGSVRQALEAAIRAGEMLGKEGEGLAAGIVKGAVMVGIAGHEAHASIIHISGQTRAVAFLKDAARRYYASILITGTAAAEIGDFEERYHVRFLGYMRLSGGGLEKIYDVFDADTAERRRKKQRTMESFARGVALYTKGGYALARDAFIDVLRADKRDAAARAYTALCSRALKEDEKERVWFTELGKG
ncbi:MAG: HAMP domain-containing protein [Blautia sp.]|nr:HAMP domain-containing protein [Blautia sp.]